MAERTTLSKACLSSILNHVMQYILLLRKIHNLIDRAQRNFIWGSTNSNKIMYVINWNTTTQPKNLGGLGMQQTSVKNVTLFSSLAWRLHSNFFYLWARFLLQKSNLNTKRHPLSHSKT